MAVEPLVQVERISWERGGRNFLQDVSWSVFPGERWALIGPNGSGKSTLVQIAMGRLWPTAGSVKRSGRERLDMPQWWRGIGWISAELITSIPKQEKALDTVVSGCLAQLGLHIYPTLCPSREDYSRAHDMLVSMDAGHLADRPFGVLSQGERQQVLLARARLARPMALVLDEPCAGMDPGVREQFLHWLNGYVVSLGDLAVILITHHIEEIVPAFDRLLALSHGRVIALGDTATVLTKELLERLYGIPVASLDQRESRYWPIWADPKTAAVPNR